MTHNLCVELFCCSVIRGLGTIKRSYLKLTENAEFQSFELDLVTIFVLVDEGNDRVGLLLSMNLFLLNLYSL